MSDCIFCNAEKGETKLDRIYEDKEIVAVVHPRPAVPGHVIVFPKKHYQIFEQISDYEAAGLFNIANKISIAVFEGIKAAGTNIILQNGVAAGQEIPHVCIHIIPRKEGDNIDFQWQPKRLTEEQMSSVELKVKEAASEIGKFEKEKKKESVKIEKKIEKIKAEEQKENYLIKQLERIP